MSRYVGVVAALALGVALPLVGGGTPATAACGTGPASPTPAVRAGFGTTPLGLEVTTGGEPLLLDAEFSSTGDGPVRPQLTVEAYGPEGHQPEKVELRPEDVSVDLAVDGTWTHLPLRPGCDASLRTAPAAPGVRTPGGRSTHGTFRVTLGPDLPEEVTSLGLTVLGRSGTRSGGSDRRTVQVRHRWPAAAAGRRAGPPSLTGALCVAAGALLLVGVGVLPTVVRRRNGLR